MRTSARREWLGIIIKFGIALLLGVVLGFGVRYVHRLNQSLAMCRADGLVDCHIEYNGGLNWSVYGRLENEEYQ